MGHNFLHLDNRQIALQLVTEGRTAFRTWSPGKEAHISRVKSVFPRSPLAQVEAQRSQPREVAKKYLLQHLALVLRHRPSLPLTKIFFPGPYWSPFPAPPA